MLQSLVAMLSFAVLCLPNLACAAAAGPSIAFPPDAGLVNVKTDYGAAGDGKTDDTEAIRRAIDENVMTMIYFPDGEYLISDSVGLFDAKPHSRDRFRNLQGQSEDGTIIRLAPNSAGFDDPRNPKVMISTYDGQSTGDAMHTYVRHMTLEVGPGNPGAAALRFMTNNTGAVEHVTIRSTDPDKAGAIGLDLRQSQNGPGLSKHVTVVGFDRGVRMGNTFSMVFDHLTLRDQRRIAFDNEIGRITIGNLRTENAPLAFRNGKHGHLTLIDADLVGGPGTPGGDAAAIEYQSDKIFLRDVRVEGYAHLARSGTDGQTLTLNEHGEAYPLPSYTLFEDTPAATLRLPIEPTPAVPWENDLAKWVGVGDGSGEGKLGKDITAETQAAFDRAAEIGATTVYFRKGKYHLSAPIRVHGSVNRVIGMSSELNFKPTEALSVDGDGSVFILDGLKSDTIVFERFFLFGGWDRPAVCVMDNRDAATVVVKNLGWTGHRFKRDRPGGRWFIEDVAGSREGSWTVGEDERLWAWQLNPESPQTPMIVAQDGGRVWVLGLKTEGRATHVIAKDGALVEVLGGVAYQSWGNQPLDPPMFDITDSALSATLGFYHHQHPFATIVRETRDGRTRHLTRDQLEGYHLPVYRAQSTDAARTE